MYYVWILNGEALWALDRWILQDPYMVCVVVSVKSAVLKWCYRNEEAQSWCEDSLQ